MGVLACYRAGCENIMCDRYSHRYGYICNECFEEIASKGVTDIQKFMDAPKRTTREELEEEFPTRWEEDDG